MRYISTAVCVYASRHVNTGKIFRGKWIVTDEANGVEKFSESPGSLSVALPYLHTLTRLKLNW